MGFFRSLFRSVDLPAVASRSPRVFALLGRTLPAAQLGPTELRGRQVSVQAGTKAERLKVIDDLPGPSFPTTLYRLLIQGYADKTHRLQVLHKNLYGPIWRSKIGPFDIVNVASAELIAQVINQEGKYPLRVELPHWKEYRDMRGHAYGLHVGTGAEWSRIRKVLNLRMLKPQEALSYAPVIQEVVSDLLRRMEMLRNRSQDQETVSDLTTELYKFGFEGVSSILFETRLGCLQEEIPKDTLRFIAAVNDMMSMSEILLLFPRWSRSILPFWRRFVHAWDVLHSVSKTLIDRRVSEIEAEVCRGKTGEGLYLTYLLSSDKLSRADIYTSITELLLGGIDTTSNTLSWALYHLARDPRVQDQLYREVNAVCPDRVEPTTDDLRRMPYLKAVIKETLRLYPVVPGNGRYITENEVIVDKYCFPKKTLFHLCHYAASRDAAEFDDAECFLPDRWLRHGPPGTFQHHPYSSIPFGVGVRGCVGKRVAEIEMYFALSRLMQHYEVRPENGAPHVEARTRTLLVPSKPINLRFLSRT